MPLISEEPMQQVRRRPTNKDIPKIIKKLMKIPVEPPCDACPWRLFPDRVQGCQNAGCGYMAIFIAVQYYQKAKGYWPYKGEEKQTAEMLRGDAEKLLTRIHKPEE